MSARRVLRCVLTMLEFTYEPPPRDSINWFGIALLAAPAGAIVADVLRWLMQLAYSVRINVLFWTKKRRFPFHGRAYLFALLAVDVRTCSQIGTSRRAVRLPRRSGCSFERSSDARSGFPT